MNAIHVQTDFSRLSLAEMEAIMVRKREEENRSTRERREQYEAKRETVVNALVETALHVSDALHTFKETAFEEMRQLWDGLKEYSRRHQESKGNFEVTSKDGNRKVSFRRQDNGIFDERSTQAEEHLISFVNNRFAQDDATRDLIMSLLERRKGQLDIKLVQRLYAMEDRFEEEEWKQGLRLLRESWLVTETCDYITFHQKDRNGRWELISLNFASI